MSQPFGSIPTTHYLQREAARAAGGAQIQFSTFAVGDGNGTVPALSSAGGGLVHEVYRAAVTGVAVNGQNAQQVDITCLIPDAAGSFTGREVAIFDETGAQCVAAITDFQKYSTADGQTSDYKFIVSLAVGNTAAVTIFAPNSGYATQSYVDTAVAGILIAPYTATEGVKIVGHQASLDVPNLAIASSLVDNDLIPKWETALGKHTRFTASQLAAYVLTKITSAPTYGAALGVALAAGLFELDIHDLALLSSLLASDEIPVNDPSNNVPKKMTLAILLSWLASNGLQPTLGFTPVQQSGGAFQLANKVAIGWDGAGLRAQVDGTDLGRILFASATTRIMAASDGVTSIGGTLGAAYASSLQNNGIYTTTETWTFTFSTPQPDTNYVVVPPAGSKTVNGFTVTAQYIGQSTAAPSFPGMVVLR